MKIIGLLLLIIYLLHTKKYELKNILSLTEGAYMLLALSFITNNYELYPIAITFCITNLIAKIFILKIYNLISTYDLIFHYFTALISVILLAKNKHYKYNYKYLLILLVVYTVINILYKIIFNKFIYPDIKLNTLDGLLKMIIYMIIIVVIFTLLKNFNF